MVPKIHAKGTSFRGLANYVLHDKGRAESSDRVEWVRTRNLATQNGHAAWRVMAATAMQASELKARAGIKNTGRKSSDVALHVTLSWHPDQSDGLTKDEMLRAADGAIRALGAEDRQAIVVAHNDEEQPHVHLVINRVSPSDGRMLSSSKEKLRLSRWALDLEQSEGKVLCEEREHNWRARDRSEYTRGQKDTPRHIHDLIAASDRHPDGKRIATEQKALDTKLGQATRRLRVRHAKEWGALLRAQKLTERAINEDARKAAMQAVGDKRVEFGPRWKALYNSQAQEIKDFEKREKSVSGRARNVLRSVEFKKMFSRGDKGTLSEVYTAIASEGGRLAALQRAHRAAERALHREQRSEERAAVTEARVAGRSTLRESRSVFDAERSTLLFRHAMEDSANRTVWRTRSSDRMAAFRVDCDRQSGQEAGPLTAEQARAALDQFYAKSSRRPKDHNQDRDLDRGR